jgi:hypothetical protein
MLIQILKGTPTWVFVLFVSLVAIGILQSRARDVNAARLAILPAAFIAFSLYGVITAFGAHPHNLAAWMAGLAAATMAVRRLKPSPDARWDASTQTFHVPGTWMPLALMMAVFFARYAISVSLALDPGLAGEATFAIAASLAYGALSGAFLGRALSLFALRPAAPPIPYNPPDQRSCHGTCHAKPGPRPHRPPPRSGKVRIHDPPCGLLLGERPALRHQPEHDAWRVVVRVSAWRMGHRLGHSRAGGVPFRFWPSRAPGRRRIGQAPG